MSHTLRTYAAFAAVVAAFIGLAVLLAPGTASARPDPGSTTTAPAVSSEVLTAAFGGGAGYTYEQVREIRAAADRVCEGIRAEVPMVDMTAALSTAYGLDDATARNFVTVVARAHC
jgi:hypothetical protein